VSGGIYRGTQPDGSGAIGAGGESGRMGLDTSHECWHGAYSAFTRWRHELATVAGYDVVHVDGEVIPRVMIEWGHLTEANLFGEWAETPSDP